MDAVEPRIRELLQGDARMPATVIAERIGWGHSIRLLSGRVAELRDRALESRPYAGWHDGSKRAGRLEVHGIAAQTARRALSRALRPYVARPPIR